MYTSIQDIILLCENNLYSEMPDSETVGDTDYVVHRCDRILATSNNLSGGGFVLAIRKNVVHKRLYSSSNLKSVFFHVTENPCAPCCCHVYIFHHLASPLYYSDLYDAVIKMVEVANSKIIFKFGDLNLPYLDLDLLTLPIWKVNTLNICHL